MPLILEENVASRSMAFRERRRNYESLALAVLGHALRDATGTRAMEPEQRLMAIDFLLSEEAEFWAETARVNIWRIRRRLELFLSKPPVEEMATAS